MSAEWCTGPDRNNELAKKLDPQSLQQSSMQQRCHQIPPISLPLYQSMLMLAAVVSTFLCACCICTCCGLCCKHPIDTGALAISMGMLALGSGPGLAIMAAVVSTFLCACCICTCC